MSSLLSGENNIIASVLAGNTSDFRKLVERYQKPIFRFTCNLIGDTHEAEDLTQDVFLAAYDRLKSFDETRAAFQTWLFTIARNRCLNHLKRKRPEFSTGTTASCSTDSRVSDAGRAEFWEQLNDAMETLPLDQKSAFVLAEIEQLSYEEIARIEQTGVGTVKSRIFRAKQRLRTAMQPAVGEKP